MTLTKLLTGLSILIFTQTAMANEFAFADGTYEMQLQIGDKTFNDELELTTNSLSFLNADLTGTVRVPGNFEAPLAGTARYQIWAGVYSFEFSILAKENGQEFKVYYSGQINSQNPGIMKGTAHLEQNKLLGKFTATKKK